MDIDNEGSCESTHTRINQTFVAMINIFWKKRMSNREIRSLICLKKRITSDIPYEKFVSFSTHKKKIQMHSVDKLIEKKGTQNNLFMYIKVLNFCHETVEKPMKISNQFSSLYIIFEINSFSVHRYLPKLKTISFDFSYFHFEYQNADFMMEIYKLYVHKNDFNAHLMTYIHIY